MSVMTKGTSRQDCIEIQNTIEYIIEQLHVSKSEIRIETDKSLEKHSPLKLTEEDKESYHCLPPIKEIGFIMETFPRRKLNPPKGLH